MFKISKEKIKCKICGKEQEQITHAHLKTHNITMKEYFEKFPDATRITKTLKNKMIENQIKSQYSSNNCKICNKPIKWNKQFCSKKCSNSRRQTLKLECCCLECNDIFYKSINSSRKFCSRICYDKYTKNNRNSKTKLFEYIRQKYNYSCALCQNSNNIRIHHINENPKDNVEDNLIVLCESCHRRIHSRFLATVYKTFTIEIAHKLSGHPTCGFIHGHSVDITVGVKGKIDLQTGMVIDFKDLKKILKEVVIDKFDHSFLNDTFKIPTAEIFAYYIFIKLCEAGLNVEVVRVHETRDNYAEFKIK
jgi:6-pyruvoyltetrahydropterin/6-carboxytetrahydropterin synthase